MWRSKKAVLITVLLLAALVGVAPANAQEGSEATFCAEDYEVQPGDWVSLVAEEYYGDVEMYPVIVAATNIMSFFDGSYTPISDPETLEAGWKLCVPSEEMALSVMPE